MSEQIEELDIDGLEADLYYIIQDIEKQNYQRASRRAWILWAAVHKFRLSLDDRHLPATTDRDLRALLTKALYWLRNRKRLPCYAKGYNCEWVYPYGFVPEGGCPYHD